MNISYSIIFNHHMIPLISINILYKKQQDINGIKRCHISVVCARKNSKGSPAQRVNLAEKRWTINCSGRSCLPAHDCVPWRMNRVCNFDAACPSGRTFTPASRRSPIRGEASRGFWELAGYLVVLRNFLSLDLEFFFAHPSRRRRN